MTEWNPGDLTPDELLTTLYRECIGVAIQVPTGDNTRGWHEDILLIDQW